MESTSSPAAVELGFCTLCSTSTAGGQTFRRQQRRSGLGLPDGSRQDRAVICLAFDQPGSRLQQVADTVFNTQAEASPVRRVNASRYLAAVFAAISSGSSGAGGFLSQPMDSR